MLLLSSYSPSEPDPAATGDFQDPKAPEEQTDERFGKEFSSPQSAWQRICPTHRLLLVVTALCFVLSLLVITLGVKAGQLSTDQQQTWESLQSFNKTVSTGLSSLRQKENSTRSRLARLEQTLSHEVNETQRVKQRLESLLETVQQDSRSLHCQLVELKSNGSKAGCCPKGWVARERSCYWISRARQPWMEAKEECERKDSHLVVINSPAEKVFVNQFRKSSYMWIGLTDSSGSWTWVDGTGYTVNAEDWGEGQPDHWYGHGLGGGEDCVHISSDDRWNDNHCSRSFTWMCEQELKV